jgi:hypothetical protein
VYQPVTHLNRTDIIKKEENFARRPVLTDNGGVDVLCLSSK